VLVALLYHITVALTWYPLSIIITHTAECTTS